MHPSFPEILITKVLSKEASAEEIEQLNNWLKLGSENVRIFQEYKLIYNNPPKGIVSFDANSAFKKIETELIEKSSTQFRFTYVSIAASLLLLLTLGIFYFNSNRKSASIGEEWQTFTTGVSERKSFKLPDGSIIALNSESILKWRNSSANRASREVILHGEAFFDVSKDSLHPFIVQTANIYTRVLGTSFNISSSSGIIKVSVASGSVEVKHPESKTLLIQQQQFTWLSGNQKWWVEQVNPEDVSPWRSGALVFENTRMDSAAIVLENWYGINIFFQNKLIQDCRITGRFKDETLLHVLDAISEATGIKYVVNKKEVKLMGTLCK